MPEVSFKTIDSVDVSGKRVLVRVDLNVPMKNGQVTDATRIERAVPTLAELAAKGAKVIVLSHFGRPDGKRVPEMSLKPLVEPLSKALGKPVAFAEDCIGPLAEDAVRALKPGEVLLLENLRFHAEEEKNDPEFAKALASLADLYVNDAFGAAHRAHASVEGITRFLPRAAAGLLMEQELTYLGRALDTLRHRGELIPDALLAHLAPLGWQHVNLTGDYLWGAESVLGPDGFRPLRGTSASPIAIAA